MIARALLAIGVLLGSTVVAAQSGDDYLKVVRLYRDQPEQAAQTIAKYSGQAIGRGVQQCRAGRCTLQQMKAAAMLHADAAALVIGPNGIAGRDQVHFGRELLEIAANVAASNQAFTAEMKALKSFGGRWYAMNARLLLAYGFFDVARQVASEGRIRYPESPDLFVALGLITEWRAGFGLDGGDLRGLLMRGRVSAQASASTADYRRALAIDPGHAGARVRLAWAHLLDNDRRVWEDVSPAVMTDANREARFLAHLIRGTAAEHEKNAPAALTEYTAAFELHPDSQTACIAMSSAQALNGQVSDSRNTAAECLKLRGDASSVDSWTLFRLGLMDTTTTDGLREEARRP